MDPTIEEANGVAAMRRDRARWATEVAPERRRNGATADGRASRFQPLPPRPARA
jgi:hypothetical protein